MYSVPSKYTTYHDAEAKTERCGEEGIAVGNLEVTLARKKSYYGINTYYTGTEDAC